MKEVVSTAVICLVLLVIVVAAVRSYLKKLKSGCCGAGGDVVKPVRPADRDLSHYPYVNRDSRALRGLKMPLTPKGAFTQKWI